MPIGLVLGGGAPNLTLMSGALLALEKAGIEFKVISTTGAGMLAGLLFTSPKKEHEEDDLATARRKALTATQHMGIDDLIYKFMPVNYKVFQKPGLLAEMLAPTFNDLFLRPWPNETPAQRLMRDWQALIAATLMPSSLSPASKGLCQAPSWIEAMVDFEGLTTNLGDTLFRLGAYSMEDRKEVSFNREEITIDHCKAALAMPLIYQPFKLKDPKTGVDKTYLEGSAFNPLEINPGDVMFEGDVDTIIFFDILGYRELIEEPENLVDAWVQSIIAPLTRLSEVSVENFKYRRDQHARDRFLSDMTQAAELVEADPEAHKTRTALALKNKELYELVDLLGSAEAGIGEFDDRAQAYLDSHDDPGLKKLVDLALEDYDAFAGQREAFLKKRQSGSGLKSSRTKTHSCRSELLRMPFGKHIPEDHWPHVLDWSNSNMTELFRIGYKTGVAFIETHRERLESSMGKKISDEVKEELEPA